jgi:hypothetical protein
MNSALESADDLKRSLDAYIERISEGHRMHRKVRFLLDIRGLLIINKIEGDYVEFGVYRGEMMYAAAKILSPHIRRYIGLDTFTGLPEPVAGRDEAFVFEKPGFMRSPRGTAEAMMEGYDAVMIEGDFREGDVQSRLAAETSKISVVSIDCNWPSSVEAAVRMCVPHLQCGSIVYMDDYFVGTRKPNFNEAIMRRAKEQSGLRFEEFQTYPPCARAFLVEAR